MHLAADTFPKERFGLITGSRCSVLFPDRGDGAVGKKTYAKSLANEKYFSYYDEVSTWQMEHGTMGEHFAYLHFQQYIDRTIFKGDFISDGYYGGSPDYEVLEYGIDFKCSTSLNKWLDYFHLPVSKDQFHQCQMYMFLRKKDLWKIGAFLTETQFMNDNGLTYPVPEDKRMILKDVPKDPTWEERLKESAPKVIEMRDEFYSKLKVKFG